MKSWVLRYGIVAAFGFIFLGWLFWLIAMALILSRKLAADPQTNVIELLGQIGDSFAIINVLLSGGILIAAFLTLRTQIKAQSDQAVGMVNMERLQEESAQALLQQALVSLKTAEINALVAEIGVHDTAIREELSLASMSNGEQKRVHQNNAAAKASQREVLRNRLSKMLEALAKGLGSVDGADSRA